MLVVASPMIRVKREYIALFSALSLHFAFPQPRTASSQLFPSRSLLAPRPRTSSPKNSRRTCGAAVSEPHGHGHVCGQDLV